MFDGSILLASATVTPFPWTLRCRTYSLPTLVVAACVSAPLVKDAAATRYAASPAAPAGGDPHHRPHLVHRGRGAAVARHGGLASASTFRFASSELELGVAVPRSSWLGHDVDCLG
jgi:hypothetical protein